MVLLRRSTIVLLGVVLSIVILSRRSVVYQPRLYGSKRGSVLVGPVKDDGFDDMPQSSGRTSMNPTLQAEVFHDASAYYPAGTAKSIDQKYSRGVVIGRLSSENTTWLSDHLFRDEELVPYLYVVDDLSATLHTPMNKGHEAMVYLTYILDHYDNLPDVSIFMHPHQRAWHTPELLNHDASEVLERLSSERVTREGYMNLRCHWDPGCPERIYPGPTSEDKVNTDEKASAAAWTEMFPDDPLPRALGAPCCAQFAVARHRIQNIPKANFERYRSWLINTKENDWVSGRVFEYLWQKIFTNQAQLCPDARVCYCDGYGICFATSELYEQWFDHHFHWSRAIKKLDAWKEKARVIDNIGDWSKVEEMKLDIPIPGRDRELQQEIDERLKILTVMRTEAVGNGISPQLRARIAGRQWKKGDGF